MVEFKHVNCGYEKNIEVLHDVSFSIGRGNKVGLIGANGAGKSTIMKSLLGLVGYDGEIFVDGEVVSKANLALIRQKVGFVLQNSDNQMFMPTVYADMKFGPLNYGKSPEETDKKIDEVLEQLGITDLKYKYNHKISGGEKRMAAIATVLAMEPELIVMDEPSASLDPYNRRQIINAIKNLDKTMLIASHDLDMILDVCDEVILIAEGKVVAQGETMSILSDRKLLESSRLELPFSLAGQMR